MKKDRELIQDFQNGDEEAFNELVRRYLDLVHGFFQKLTNDEMEAEDLAQTVFIKLFKSTFNSAPFIASRNSIFKSVLKSAPLVSSLAASCP